MIIKIKLKNNFKNENKYSVYYVFDENNIFDERLKIKNKDAKTLIK